MADSELFSRIDESLKRQTLLATLGARLLRAEPGEVEIELPAASHILQQHGFVHAGAISSIADSACGYACLTRMEPGDAVLSIEFKVNLLAPASGERFVAKGKVLRSGRTISVATAEVLAFKMDQPPALIAAMQATMMRVAPRNGLAG